MTNFNGGGRGLPQGQGYVCSKIENKLSAMSPSGLLHFVRNDERTANRSDDRFGRNVSSLIIIFCVLFSNVFAQSPTQVGAAAKVMPGEPDPRIAIPISGVILDDATGLPFVKKEGYRLPEVSIFPASVFLNVNDRGEFSFKTVFSSKGTVKAYYPGYSIEEIKFDLTNRGPFIIRLKASQDTGKHIEEVVVTAETGYFRVPEERATGSFVYIDSSLLNRSVGSNVLDRLAGVTRGLIFNQRNVGASTIEGAPSMSIRGLSSIRGNKEPLIILDDFPFGGDVNSINPEDIESVTVLQDAAASSIWGARAGNGVIVLTSKKGKFEQPLKIGVRSDVSISEKPNLYYNPTIPMDEFIEIERFLYNKGAWNSRINQVYPYITPTIEALLAERNGHIDEIEMERRIAQLKTQDVRSDLNRYVYRPVQLYKSAVSFTGGAKQHNYYLSVGYDKNLKDIPGHQDQRLTLQARNSYRLLNNKLSFEAQIQFSTAKNRTGSDAPFQVLYNKLADDNGIPLSIGGGRGATGLRQSYIDTAGMGLLKDWNLYPLDNISQYSETTEKLSYQIQPVLSYKPTDWLSVLVNYRYMRGVEDQRVLRTADHFDVRDLYNRFAQINYEKLSVQSPVPDGARVNERDFGYQAHYFRGSFNIDKSWKDLHHLDAVAGFEVNSKSTLDKGMPLMLGYQESTESYAVFDATVRHRQYLTGNLGFPVSSASFNMTRLYTLDRSRLYFGNTSYTYDKRYTATFSARKDEANIFGVDINQRGRPFWSAGLRWQIHEENFYNVAWLSKLVLRGTHGYTGNVSSISAFTTSRISPIPYFLTGLNYQSITTPPNPMLSWENVKMTNLAADFSAFNRRLSGSIEYYHKYATDLLSSEPMNPSSGVVFLTGNWSSLKGWGWDLNLAAKNIRSKNFEWQSDLILSYTNEKVIDYKLKPTSDLNYLTSNLGNYPIEGKPLYGIYSFASAGLDATGQPQGYLDGVLSQDYTKIYNNTKLSDFVYHGRATPPVFGSLRNTFQYKDLELSFNIVGQFGYFIRRAGLNQGLLYSVSTYKDAPFQYDYFNRWQQPGDENKTHVPVAQYPVVANRENFYNMSEHLIERGDHIRLRDIKLSYSVRLPRLGLQSLQVYVYVNNLGVLWSANSLGFDPEAVYSNRLVYPSVRTYSCGLNLTF